MNNLVLKDVASVVPRHVRRLEERVAKISKRLQWSAVRSSLVWFVTQLHLLFLVYKTSSSTFLRCQHWWVSLSICILTTILYLLILSDITLQYLHKEAIIARIAAVRSRTSARRTAHYVCTFVLGALAFVAGVVTAWTSRSAMCSPT